MSEIYDTCGDDRFELIAKARAKLLDATNIESRPDEIAVLDSILFRCWQMGWLDRLREGSTEQAIAATLGSDREAELEALVRELWHLVNNRSGYGYAAALEHIEALGIEVDA